MNPEAHISQHIKYKEVRCKCRQCDGGFITQPTLELFERIREAAGGKPLTITSGFRCEPYNKIVGGVKNSYHMQGKALDIVFPDHIKPWEFYKICMGKAQGAGLYSWGVHVDTGKTKHQWMDKSWNGSEAERISGRNRPARGEADSKDQKESPIETVGMDKKKVREVAK